jgi:acylglycerol lipase
MPITSVQTRQALRSRCAGALRRCCVAIGLLFLGGCVPLVDAPGPAQQITHLAPAHFLTRDGAVLPVRSWLPPSPPHTVIIALHGFNDYSRAFEMPGTFFRSHGIACYAYDQRGFGKAPHPGLWPGTTAYTDDLVQFVAAIRLRHPGIPVYVLGESMGAAVGIVAMTDSHAPLADGLILSAPAVWSRDTMPWYQRALLAGAAHTTPWLRLTGDGLHIVASDNIEMLRGLGRDPWVIKATRVDAIYGLADLMDEAMERVPRLRIPTLVLLGDRDEIIPKPPLELLLDKLPQHLPTRVASYPRGYHLLLRDLQADKPWRDIVAWVGNRMQPLPSGADRLIGRNPERPPEHFAQIAERRSESRSGLSR